MHKTACLIAKIYQCIEGVGYFKELSSYLTKSNLLAELTIFNPYECKISDKREHPTLDLQN